MAEESVLSVAPAMMLVGLALLILAPVVFACSFSAQRKVVTILLLLAPSFGVSAGVLVSALGHRSYAELIWTVALASYPFIVSLTTISILVHRTPGNK